MSNFADLVEEIKALPLQDKEELQGLIEKYLVEERREEIYQNYMQSMAELNEGKVEFSSDAGNLKGLLVND